MPLYQGRLQEVEYDEEGYQTILEGWKRSQRLPAIPPPKDQVHDPDWYYDPKNGPGGAKDDGSSKDNSSKEKEPEAAEERAGNADKKHSGDKETRAEPEEKQAKDAEKPADT